MRLVRYEVNGESKVGVLKDTTITEIESDFGRSEVPDLVSAVRDEDRETTNVETGLEETRLLAPIPRPGKIICLGLNYRDHAEEGGNEIPDRPLLFSKATSAVVGPDDDVEFPYDVEQLDYEAELAIIVGREGRRIPRDEASNHIAGYTIFNDISARDVQYAFSQYFRGKSYDTFAPMGPALVTTDDVTTSDLAIRTFVNGDLRQDSSTANMIFPVDEVLESVSKTMTLYPGDVIATGTPPGVGVHRDPPRLLSEGDKVTVEIDGLGSLTNTVVAEPRE